MQKKAGPRLHQVGCSIGFDRLLRSTRVAALGWLLAGVGWLWLLAPLLVTRARQRPLSALERALERALHTLHAQDAHRVSSQANKHADDLASGA